MRDGKLQPGHSQEKKGVDQRDDGALAAVDDGKVVHEHQ
jgi:hypothetical protein